MCKSHDINISLYVHYSNGSQTLVYIWIIWKVNKELRSGKLVEGQGWTLYFYEVPYVILLPTKV